MLIIEMKCSYCFGKLEPREDDQQKTLKELLEEPPRFHNATCRTCFLDREDKVKQPKLPGM